MTLTLDQARAMHWPFLNPRQPMGALLDQGALSVHDLQRALRKAYSPRFKTACQMILQELPPAPGAPPQPPTRSVVSCDRPRVSPLPRVCPICADAVQADGSGWRCVADCTHYWQYRTDRLRAARERWLNALSPDVRQYLDEAWLTTCDRTVREQYLSDHALTYPANS
jgi:hypothetical protein